jgi:hypothetical protein
MLILCNLVYNSTSSFWALIRQQSLWFSSQLRTVFWPGTGVLQSYHLIDEWSVELEMQQMAMQDACQCYMTPTQ